MRAQHPERGAAAVEFALVLPALLLLVLGIIDFGRIFSAQQTLTYAARAGARVMVLQNSQTAAVAAAQNAASPLGQLPRRHSPSRRRRARRERRWPSP
ncbi:TadE/TadG family type IV pilus assembly protein [Sinomonas atrocyanea]